MIEQITSTFSFELLFLLGVVAGLSSAFIIGWLVAAIGAGVVAWLKGDDVRSAVINILNEF